MDGRRNFSPDPDAEPRWYPDDRGYDERGRDDRRDERLDDRRDDRRDERSRDDRAYGDDRGYTPTRYADDREYDDGYRVPEPRGAARGYGDPLPYGDSPSGQFSAPLPAGPESVDAESVSRSRRSEAIDRSALQRPVSGGAPSAPAAQLPPPQVTVPTGPPAQAGFGPQNAFAAPTTLTAAVPPPPAAAEPGGAVYRSKRPGLAVALVLLTVVFEVPVLRLFLTAMTADKIEAAGTLASIFMILGLPMFALGLYGLIGGAAASAPGVRAWSRTPLAYLPIAVLLFIAAALST
ncbi:hypothetical protein [Dactylosporangium siamense]|uniref:Uncharacterized protein n=1 Tax=Dactylosporangium siamense TaxID=685454 RepID=A0A919PIM7_9ACTN|nr:hypothetical protein [Dactylosporangium siamense]GIG44389.1 hypothetical protein Dsi01nite_024300 [Dactylosporangium siamense]